mgnify:CR=1 FL=1
MNKNCLSYALEFWSNNSKTYKMVYNSNHVINVPIDTDVKGFLDIKEFGYEHLVSSFKGLLSVKDEGLLIQYLK